MIQGSRRLYKMGTVIDIVIWSLDPEDLLTIVQRRLEQFDAIFSANREDSLLSKVNQAAGKEAVVVPRILFDLIRRGRQESLDPKSNINIAIGPLVQTWRIGFSDAKVPKAQDLLAALNLTKADDIELSESNQSVFLKTPAMKLDLGSLAKGYFADLIMKELKEKGASSVMINLGGNVLVNGKNPKRTDGLWRIGIQDPRKSRGNHLGILKLSDQSVVTSGIYERQLEIAGKFYHHIFDKRTGYPTDSDMVSLSIVADSSLECELWTTKLFGKSSIEARRVIEKEPNLEGIIITRDGQVIATSGLKDCFYSL